MRINVYLLILFSLLISLYSWNAAFAIEEKVIAEKNEFGGRTVEKIYAAEDGNFQEVFKKKILYYDHNGKVSMMDGYLSDRFLKEKGYFRSVTYYSSGGKTIKKEFYYTDSYAEKEGGYKSINYFDAGGQVVKTEILYTEKFVKIYEFDRLITYPKERRKELYLKDKLIKSVP